MSPGRKKKFRNLFHFLGSGPVELKEKKYQPLWFFFAGTAKSSMVPSRVSWHKKIKLCKRLRAILPVRVFQAAIKSSFPPPPHHTHLPTFHPNPCCLPTVESPDQMTKCQEAMPTHSASNDRTLAPQCPV